MDDLLASLADCFTFNYSAAMFDESRRSTYLARRRLEAINQIVIDAFKKAGKELPEGIAETISD